MKCTVTKFTNFDKNNFLNLDLKIKRSVQDHCYSIIQHFSKIRGEKIWIYMKNKENLPSIIYIFRTFK